MKKLSPILKIELKKLVQELKKRNNSKNTSGVLNTSPLNYIK